MRFPTRRFRPLPFRAKIFFLFAGSCLLIVIPTVWLIADTVEARVYERATEELGRSVEALAIHWRHETELLLSDARVRALDPAVVDPLLAGDTARLHRAITRGMAEGRLAFATDSVASSLVGPALDSATVWEGVGRGSIVRHGEDQDRYLRVGVWPVWAEGRVAGMVGVGGWLDASVARRMQEVAGSDVAIVVDGQLVASSLPDMVAADLERIPLAAALERGGTVRRTLAGHPFLSTVHLLPARGEAATAALLFHPIAMELRVVDGILRSLVVIGIAALVLALVLAWLVARIVARPAQALAGAADELARGRYDAPLPTASRDEFGLLAGAFAEMRLAIAEREKRLRSAQAELVHREKLAAMGRLVAQLSHEINNPIYNIQNCLEALDRRWRGGEADREFLDLAREELARMASLTRQLLDQSRPLSDAAAPLDLNRVVERVVRLAEPKLRTHEVRLDLALDPALPTVVGHPDAIQEVIANLVDNAIDAMPGGGVLALRTRGGTEVVEVEVADSGTGIAEEDLPRIFEAFYTTKPGVRGVGLGLFVSEGIVRGHRGELEVRTDEGGGSLFIVRLPRETLDDPIERDAARDSADPTEPTAVRDA